MKSQAVYVAKKLFNNCLHDLEYSASRYIEHVIVYKKI